MSNSNSIPQPNILSNQDIFYQLQFLRQRLALLIEAVEPGHPCYLARLTQAEDELTSAAEQLDKQATEAATRELLANDPAACWNGIEEER